MVKKILYYGVDYGIKPSIEKDDSTYVYTNCFDELKLLVESTKFDCILLDMDIEKEYVQKRVSYLDLIYPDILLIAVCGHKSVFSSIKAITLGLDHAITKPVDRYELMEYLS